MFVFAVFVLVLVWGCLHWCLFVFVLMVVCGRGGISDRGVCFAGGVCVFGGGVCVAGGGPVELMVVYVGLCVGGV